MHILQYYDDHELNHGSCKAIAVPARHAQGHESRATQWGAYAGIKRGVSVGLNNIGVGHVHAQQGFYRHVLYFLPFLVYCCHCGAHIWRDLNDLHGTRPHQNCYGETLSMCHVLLVMHSGMPWCLAATVGAIVCR